MEGDDDNKLNHFLPYPINSKGVGSFTHTSEECKFYDRSIWKED